MLCGMQTTWQSKIFFELPPSTIPRQLTHFFVFGMLLIAIALVEI
jgi:hypothetical protein